MSDKNHGENAFKSVTKAGCVVAGTSCGCGCLVPIVCLVVILLILFPIKLTPLAMTEPSIDGLNMTREAIQEYSELTVSLEKAIESRAIKEVQNKFGVSIILGDGIYVPEYAVTEEVYEEVANENGEIEARYRTRQIGTLKLDISIPDWAYIMVAQAVITNQNEYVVDKAAITKDIEQNTIISASSTDSTLTISAKYLTLEEYVLKETEDDTQKAQIAEVMYQMVAQRVNIYSWEFEDEVLIIGDIYGTIPYDDSIGGLIVKYAAEQLGYPYSQDGSKRHSTHRDCSSMVKQACNNAGIEIVDVAASQAKWCYDQGMQISVDQLEPGDLVFWAFNGNNGRWRNISHVGIYAGDGMVIEASTRQNAVVHRAIYMKNIVMCARPYN